MPLSRRAVVTALFTMPSALAFAGGTQQKETDAMYGLIGKIRCVPGKRDALIDILLQGTGAMPGCLSYVVAKDAADPDAVWVTEAWDSEASHKASLSLPAVQEAITKGRALIAGFGERFRTQPVGGNGLGAPQA
jgi:quinol monooxygenase YgiN